MVVGGGFGCFGLGVGDWLLAVCVWCVVVLGLMLQWFDYCVTY